MTHETAAAALTLAEQELRATDGTSVWFRRWTPANGADVRARCFIVHGRGEHGGRYEEVAATLAARGIASFAPDYRGHGKAGGTRGGVRRFDEYLLDIDAALAEASKDCADGLPLFACGHSLGGLILVRYTLERGADGRLPFRHGVVLSSPFFALTERPSWVTRALLSIVSRLVPDRKKLSAVAPLTRDASRNHVPRTDSLEVAWFTLSWAREILNMQDRVMADAARFALPMLILHGGADGVADPEASAQFHQACGSEDKTLELYPGLLHEVFNELPEDRAKVHKDFADWIEARIDA